MRRTTRSAEPHRPRARFGGGASAGSHRRIQQAVLIAGALLAAVWLGAGSAFLEAIVAPVASLERAPVQSMTLDDFARNLERRVEAEFLRTDG